MQQKIMSVGDFASPADRFFKQIITAITSARLPVMAVSSVWLPRYFYRTLIKVAAHFEEGRIHTLTAYIMYWYFAVPQTTRLYAVRSLQTSLLVTKNANSMFLKLIVNLRMA
jgi:hypothetical protein